MEKVVDKLTKKSCAIFLELEVFCTVLHCPFDSSFRHLYSIASTFVDYVSKWV